MPCHFVEASYATASRVWQVTSKAVILHTSYLRSLVTFQESKYGITYTAALQSNYVVLYIIITV